MWAEWGGGGRGGEEGAGRRSVVCGVGCKCWCWVVVYHVKSCHIGSCHGWVTALTRATFEDSRCESLSEQCNGLHIVTKRTLRHSRVDRLDFVLFTRVRSLQEASFTLGPLFFCRRQLRNSSVNLSSEMFHQFEIGKVLAFTSLQRCENTGWERTCIASCKHGTSRASRGTLFSGATWANADALVSL